jgi:hypothetical protein
MNTWQTFDIVNTLDIVLSHTHPDMYSDGVVRTPLPPYRHIRITLSGEANTRNADRHTDRATVDCRVSRETDTQIEKQTHR